MARIVVQMGHVGRTSGSTGAPGEQKFTAALGPKIGTLIEANGHHEVEVVKADQRPSWSSYDVLIALHADGSVNKRARGASFGYPAATAENSARLARLFQALYERAGWPGGWRNDNYTAALQNYYGYRHALARRATTCLLVEHGFITNDADRNWMWSNIDGIAAIHVGALMTYLGTPMPKVQLPDWNAQARVLRNARWYRGEIPIPKEGIAEFIDATKHAQRAVGLPTDGIYTEELLQRLLLDKSTWGPDKLPEMVASLNDEIAATIHREEEIAGSILQPEPELPPPPPPEAVADFNAGTTGRKAPVTNFTPIGQQDKLAQRDAPSYGALQGIIVAVIVAVLGYVTELPWVDLPFDAEQTALIAGSIAAIAVQWFQTRKFSFSNVDLDVLQLLDKDKP